VTLNVADVTRLLSEFLDDESAVEIELHPTSTDLTPEWAVIHALVLRY
jgi:hypothetical protein